MDMLVRIKKNYLVLGECWLILSFKTASKLYVVIVIYIKEKCDEWTDQSVVSMVSRLNVKNVVILPDHYYKPQTLIYVPVIL